MSPARRLRVAVLAGGRSSEHDVSLASARSVVSALDPARYEIAEVAIGRDGRWALDSGPDPSGHVLVPGTGTGPAETLPVRAESGTLDAIGAVDVVLPILHGPFGEDGTVQGLLELADVAYVGAGVAASALAMDKDLFKKVMRDSGIPVAAHHAIRLGDAIENPLGYPVFVKPARLGSSVGISKVRTAEELAPAVELAFRHDEKVLVEEFVEGTEVEVGVLGNRVPPPIASLPGQIDTLEHDWYDYASKYDEGGMELIVPPPNLSQETVELLQRRAVESFVAPRPSATRNVSRPATAIPSSTSRAPSSCAPGSCCRSTRTSARAARWPRSCPTTARPSTGTSRCARRSASSTMRCGA